MPSTNTVLAGGGFHHVAFRVRNYDKSIEFYTTLLGCTPKIRWKDKPQRACMLDTGDGNYIELFERPNDPAASGEGVILHIALRTTKLDEVTEKARAAGYVVTMEPKDLMFGSQPFDLKARISFFTGPDGEVIELFQNEAT